VQRAVTVVVPVRALEGAKSRLGAVLDAEERHALTSHLVARTIEVALATPGVVEVIAVSPDTDALALAAEHGARPLPQRSRGLNPAIGEARTAVTTPRMLVLPADLPAIGVDDIAAVLVAGDRAGSPSVVVAPDRHGRGTNALLLDPPDAIDTAFGGGSRAGHAWLAASADIAHAEVTGRPGLEVDLDTADDLLLVEEIAPEAVRAR
jgi:2-phospho-L-lactate guanylyltransferase